MQKDAVTLKLPSDPGRAAPPGTDTEVTVHWRQVVDAGQSPGQTIHRARAKASGTEQFRRTGITLGPELGRGGFGVVNIATQEVFARRVAVKRLLATRGDDEAERFFAEAVVTASLQHPNVVPIHDLSRDGDGRLQLVMKCVEGVAWRDLLHPVVPEHVARAGAMTREDHLDILIKVSDAVAFAHERGILHRDLKPENVMVGAFGEVQVMDWGCALAFGPMPNHPVIQRVETVDHIAGTPAYMAPEMALGKPGLLGPHTDVYLLGGILYEILTGTPPHRAGDVYGVLAHVLTGTVEPPDERTPDRGIPDELAWIAMSALTRDPRERTPSTDAFARQVKEYRAHSQAMLLAATAKEHLELARRHPDDAEDRLRRAMAAADNAVELWPERTAGLRIQLVATLAYAEHALEAGAFGSAITVSSRAQAMGEALASEAEGERAAAIAAEAQARLASQSARHRQLHVMRVALGVSAILLVCGLSIGLTVIAGAQHRTAAEQAKTEAALSRSNAAIASLEAEREQRRQDQHRAAPGLVAQARAAVAEQRFQDAEQIAEIARGFDGKLASAHALIACLRAARADYVAAAAAAADWRSCQPDSKDARILDDLCARATAATGDLPPEVTMALGEVFTRQQLFALAESRMLRPQERLALYANRLDQSWPDSGKNVQLNARSMLVSLPNVVLAPQISDLAPLAGMPFEGLNLHGTGVFDLTPLSAMPLKALDIGGTKVKELSALAKLPLERLAIDATEIADLAPLSGLRLRKLFASGCPHLSDLAALAGMPLDEISLPGTAVTDLSPLLGAPITALNISNCRIGDLAPLAKMPLESLNADHSSMDDAAMALLAGKRLGYLNVAGTAVHDLSVVRGMPLHTLNVLAAPISDFAPIRGLPLSMLFANHTAFADSSLLAGMPLKRLWLDSTSIVSIEPLRGMALNDLAIAYTGVTDLRPLSGCATLTSLSIHGTRIVDLAPLHGLKLDQLDASGTPVTSIAALAGMPLTVLGLGTTGIKDLKDLAGMPLRDLAIDHSQVTDYGPLVGFPLEVVTIGPFRNRTYAGMDALRQHRTLKRIAIYSVIDEEWRAMPTAEFWQRYDRGELE